MLEKKKQNNPARFQLKEKQEGPFMDFGILVDQKTGVNYLLVQGVRQMGLTPLLNEHGEVIIEK